MPKAGEIPDFAARHPTDGHPRRLTQRTRQGSALQ